MEGSYTEEVAVRWDCVHLASVLRQQAHALQLVPLADSAGMQRSRQLLKLLVGLTCRRSLLPVPIVQQQVIRAAAPIVAPTHHDALVAHVGQHTRQHACSRTQRDKGERLSLSVRLARRLAAAAGMLGRLGLLLGLVLLRRQPPLHRPLLLECRLRRRRRHDIVPVVHLHPLEPRRVRGRRLTPHLLAWWLLWYRRELLRRIHEAEVVLDFPAQLLVADVLGEVEVAVILEEPAEQQVLLEPVRLRRHCWSAADLLARD